MIHYLGSLKHLKQPVDLVWKSSQELKLAQFSPQGQSIILFNDDEAWIFFLEFFSCSSVVFLWHIFLGGQWFFLLQVPTVFLCWNHIHREGSGSEEPVHILAYYGICGPTKIEELEKFLMNIRDGRFLRAKSMVKKLNKLKLPLLWEHVTHIAGKDVAPGRLHVARALVEAGHVSNLKQAFARYLYDGGPAYST